MAEQAAPPAYVNGRFVRPDEPALSVVERGFALGDGVFETMVAAAGRIFRLEDHLGRLKVGAGILELVLPTRDVLDSALRETWSRSGLGEAVLRLTVARGPELGRGARPPDAARPTVVVRATPLVRSTEAGDRGVTLHTCSFPRNERSPLVRAKFLAYTEAIAASLEARKAGADDALWLNTRGDLASATSSNLFVMLEGRLVTPPCEDGALPGVARREVMQLAAKMGVDVAEESLPPACLQDATEVFLTNVVRGPVAVVAVDGLLVGEGRPGPVARSLADAYWREVGIEEEAGGS